MTILSTLKDKIFWFLIKIEKNSLTRLFFSSIYLIFLLVLILLDLGIIWSSFPKNVSHILVLSLLVLTSITSKVLVNISSNYISELNARKNLIKNLIGSEYPEYRILNWHEKYEIFENGDCQLTRNVKIEYMNKNVMWYHLELGTTNDISLKSSVDVRAYIMPKKVRLPGVTYNIGEYISSSLVILDPPLTESNSQVELLLKIDWKYIWKDLIKYKTDTGFFTIKNITDSFTFEILSPRGYSILDYQLPPELENISNLTYIEKGIKYEIKSPPLGIYNYRINIKPI